MRYFFLVSTLTIFVWMTGFFAKAEPEKPWSQIYLETSPSVPLIFVSGRICSGALIDRDLVLTAAHCVSTLREIVLFWNQDYGRSVSAQVVAMDRSSDLALLRMFFLNEHKPLDVVSHSRFPAIGDEIVTIGHPTPSGGFGYPPFDRSSTYLLSKGIVSQMSKTSLISDLSVSPGNSGGPALNTRGQIVGVVSKKRIDRGVGNIAYLVGPEKINEFLEKNWNKKEPVPIYLAQADLGLLVWYNHWANSPASTGATENFEWELQASFWDRLVVGGHYWLGGDLKRKSYYTLGWKFQVTTPSLTLWTLTPSVGQGLSITLEHSYFPLALKYSWVNEKNNSYSVWSLGFNLF